MHDHRGAAPGHPEDRFTRLSKNAVGENTESIRARQDVKVVKELLGNRHKLYRAGLTFLLRAEDMDSLKRRRVELTTVLLGGWSAAGAA